MVTKHIYTLKSIDVFMKDLELVRFLERTQSAVFTTQQMAAILGMDNNTAKVKLTRLVKSGAILRTQRGKYSLPDTPVLAIASSIYVPSYISLLSAFEYYGTTTQTTRIIDVINPIKSGIRDVKIESGNYTIRFIKVKPNSLFGYSKYYIDGKSVFLADLEKAIIDNLTYPMYLPLDESFEAIKNGIDLKKIVSYANRIGKIAVIKRLGYMLSKVEVKISPSDFDIFSQTYVPLDPSFPRRGKYDRSWRIVINRVVE